MITRPRITLVAGFYVRPAFQGIAAFAREAGWSLDARPVTLPGFRPKDPGDGILLMPTWTEADPWLEKQNVPIVNMLSDWPPYTDLPSVLLDNYAAGQMAAAHFLDRHHTNFLFYSHVVTEVQAGRFAGFRDGVAQHGGQAVHLSWQGTQPDASVDEWLARQLSDLPKPLAVFAESDRHALEVLSACQLAGLSCPQDVAVLGLDNDELMRDLALIPLSSIDANLHQLGYLAASTLNDLLLHGTTAKTLVRTPPAKVITRQSSDLDAVQSPLVLEALQYIQSSLSAALSPEFIAQYCSVSRRRLDLAFRKHLGRTISQEVAHCRMRYARELLAYSDSSVEEIAASVGIPGITTFYRQFNRINHETPHQYRLRHKRSRNPN